MIREPNPNMRAIARTLKDWYDVLRIIGFRRIHFSLLVVDRAMYAVCAAICPVLYSTNLG
jgi:hypothetical protein